MSNARAMGRRARAGRFALAASVTVPLLAAASRPAWAAVLAMPFACSAEGGRISLARSEEHTYKVLGRREARSRTVCTSTRGGATRCRRLPIYRFSLDCNGTRVAWLEVAAVATRGGPWRATISDGRMMLRTDRNRLRTVNLPPGFAPLPDIAFRFVAEPIESPGPPAPPTASASATADVEITALPDPLVAVASGPEQPQALADADEATPTGEDTPRKTFATPALALDEPLVTPVSTGVPPAAPRMGEGWSATVSTIDEAATSLWTKLVPPGGSPGSIVALLIAGLLLTASAMAGRKLYGRATRMEPQPSASATGTPAAVTPDAPPPPPPPEMPKRSAATQESAAPPSDRPDPLPEVPPPLPQADAVIGSSAAEAALDQEAWAAIIEMKTTADALVGLVGQMVADHVPEGPLRHVLISDLESITGRLDGPELAAALAAGRLDLVHPIYAQAIADLERARTLARIEHERALAPALSQDDAPATVAEACAFLGINPRAGEAVAKKVVDALRQSWHPDLAGDEVDRAEREARIKQINSAWDLIRGR